MTAADPGRDALERVLAVVYNGHSNLAYPTEDVRLARAYVADLEAEQVGDCIVCGSQPALYCESCSGAIDRHASGEPTDGEMIDFMERTHYILYYAQPGSEKGEGWWRTVKEPTYPTIRLAIRAAMRREHEGEGTT